MDNVTELINMVKKSVIFSSLPEEKIRSLLSQFKKVDLNKDDHLFRQGDLSNEVYILLKGTVRAYLTTTHGEEKNIGIIEPSEAIGELGALTGGSYSLSVVALVDCRLLGLRSEDFRELCREYPLVLFETVKPIIRRSLKTIQLMEEKPRIKKTVFIPIDSSINLHKFQKLFSECIEDEANINVHPVAKTDHLMHLVTENQETGTDLIFFYHERPGMDELSYLVADGSYFYLVVEATQLEHFTVDVANLLAYIAANHENKVHLVLLHADDRKLPQGTRHWLKKFHFDFHYHLRQTCLEDYQRLYHFIANSAKGLVLGGGGFKGLAHLGVLNAFHERKIDIDIVGGTSVGAIVAACYALCFSNDEINQRFLSLIASGFRSLSLRSMTWPLVSLFDAVSATKFLQETFGHVFIEDLWMPFFCVSANLSTHSQVVHREGLLWEKLRASSSLPGLVPPTVIEGQLHFDGGLSNNLPVDVMRELIGQKNVIIAAQLSNYLIDKKKYRFPPMLPLKDAVSKRFGLAHKDYVVPDLIETFLDALLLGASHKEVCNSLEADILIKPDLSLFQTTKAIRKNEQKVIDAGYKEAMKVLTGSKAERNKK